MTVRQAMRYEEASVGSFDDYILSDEWVMEQKMDGTRVLAVITPMSVDFFQRDGKPLAHTAATQHLNRIRPALWVMLGHTPGELVIDGELMIEDGEYRIFDVPYARFGGYEVIQPMDDLLKRRGALEAAWQTSQQAYPDDNPITLVKQARTWREKQKMWKDVREAGVEGVMVKHIAFGYHPGQRVKHTLKLKLVKTADVVVTKVTRPDPKHGTIEFGIAMTAETHPAGEYVVETLCDGVPIEYVGKCSAIGKPEVAVGDVIEVAYLYWTGITTYQPRMLRVRTDKTPAECTKAQFADYSRREV